MRATLPFHGVRRRTILVVAGLLATGALTWATAPRPAANVSPGFSAPSSSVVLVARRFIAAGNVIASDDVTTKAVLGGLPPGGLSAAQDAVGRVSANDIKPEGLVREADLRDPAAFGIAGRLAPGQRAFSIRVAEDDIVGGFLQSGDHIDIFATLPGSVFPAKNAEEMLDRSRVLLLLQDVSVLAVGENLNTNGAVQPSARTASVALTPPQLARLTLALRLGRISMAIRKPGDHAPSEAAAATLQDLLPAKAEPRQSTPSRSRPKQAGVPFYAGSRDVAMMVERAP